MVSATTAPSAPQAPTLMRPFSNLVDNLERLGVQFVMFHTKDGDGHQMHLSSWREEHVFQGIRVQNRTLCPNVGDAYLNPFLPQPVLVISCSSIALPSAPSAAGSGEEQAAKVVADSVTHSDGATKSPDMTDLSVAGSGSASDLAGAPLVRAKVHTEAVAVLDKSESTDLKLKKRGGSSCHQCKNVKSIDGLVFCQRKFDRRHRPDKRNCRKKYCPHCLMKFYNMNHEAVLAPDWFCPACAGICRCAACSRSSIGSKDGPAATEPNDEATPLAKRARSTLIKLSPSIQLPSAAKTPNPNHPETQTSSSYNPEQNVSLNDALDLPGQFSNFGPSSPTSSSEQNEMLKVSSAGAIVESSLSAGHRLMRASNTSRRPTKKQLQQHHNSSEEFAMTAAE